MKGYEPYPHNEPYPHAKGYEPYLQTRGYAPYPHTKGYEPYTHTNKKGYEPFPTRKVTSLSPTRIRKVTSLTPKRKISSRPPSRTRWVASPPCDNMLNQQGPCLYVLVCASRARIMRPNTENVAARTLSIESQIADVTAWSRPTICPDEVGTSGNRGATRWSRPRQGPASHSHPTI